jgi:hypothetical protein
MPVADEVGAVVVLRVERA